jgi:glutamyl-tRNA reductase
MPFLAVGVEHRTAPLDVRERLALDAAGAAFAHTTLAADPLIDEVTVLSTCNRTELYLFVEELEEAAEVARAYLTRSDPSLREYVQTWREMDAVEHLFRVASGLESQIPGEAQIVSQVSGALELAQASGTVGPNLHALFRSSVSCARQARAGTALGRVSSSVGAEAVRSAESTLGSLEGCSVLVVGGGEVSRLVAEGLRQRRVGALYIANRTASVAAELAAQMGGTPAQLSDIERLTPLVDLIFSATTSGEYMLTPENLPGSGTRAEERSLHIFDLAVPRDVDPSVGDLPGVTLHDLDDLLPTTVGETWNEDVRLIESVIAAEVQEFTAWYHP